MKTKRLLIIVPLLLLIAAVTTARALVIEATGADAASITAARDAFRLDLGGGDVAGRKRFVRRPAPGN